MRYLTYKFFNVDSLEIKKNFWGVSNEILLSIWSSIIKYKFPYKEWSILKLGNQFELDNFENNDNNYFAIDDIYRAYQSCKKGKNSYNLIKFEYNLEENLFSLLDDLNTDSYQISRSICFVVKKPKVREIWASDFRDRVVHHLITRKIDIFYENQNFKYHFLESSCANRVGKGTHFGILKVKKYIKHSKYYLKLDIESFFNSINRNILLEILNEDLKDIDFKNKEVILNLFKKVIFHNYTFSYIKKSSNESFSLVPYHKSLFFSEPNKKGLPIGNLTSQFLSNVYLNKLDYFISNNLGFKNYIRYVDDFVIFDDNLEKLEKSISLINTFLENKLKLKLHPKKVILKETILGLDFLGYYIKPSYSLARKRVVSNLNEKLRSQYLKKEIVLKEDIDKILNMVNSYFGHFKYCNSYNLKRKMANNLKEYFDLEKEKGNIKLKRKYDLNFVNVYLQYLYFKEKHKNYLIIFQMGNFYRFFDVQAEFISNKLNLKANLRIYSKKKHLICGFPITSKKFLDKIKCLGINYVIVKQLKEELTSGLKQRIEKEVFSDGSLLNLVDTNGGSFNQWSEDLNSILNWDLNSMTPIEVFMKISKLQENLKYKNETK